MSKACPKLVVCDKVVPCKSALTFQIVSLIHCISRQYSLSHFILPDETKPISEKLVGNSTECQVNAMTTNFHHPAREL